MLSILITIYNYNLYPLVLQLHQQFEKLNIDYEILCQDDASKSVLNEENRKINTLENCSFFELEINVGYRENKNILVSKSKYDWLLILDGDCLIHQNDFIKKYVDSITYYDGIYGGRTHPEKCPSNQKMLRWKYGKFMEDNPLENRLKKPFESFLFNNTLIKKSIFNQIKFDASFKKYGHDDTLFSYELKRLGAKINHIDNPVEHHDIDDNEVYYHKTKDAMDNLFYLYQTKKIDFNYTKLLRTLNFLEKTKLYLLPKMVYKVFEKPIEINLTGNKPYLFVFNLFRLGYICGKV
jgi:glycosyltransferase involved in cell wall biosynthesis